MTASLKALLKNVIDYAGLFPPASLSLDQSIRTYARDLSSEDNWMLARFVCPASRLQELAPYLGEFFTERLPLSVAALGRGGANPSSIIADFESDLAAIRRFREGARGAANVEVIETKTPLSPAEAERVLPAIAQRGADADVRTFCEVPFDREKLPGVVRAIARDAPHLGFKLRTGGTEAGAFPTSQQVAFAIATARDARCPMKFTAGLHHPIRLFHGSVGSKMHGFINVFVAGVLAHIHSMDEHGIALILETESPGDFGFDEYGLSWKTLRAQAQRIEQVRRNGVISFGSCSFDEPRDDLRALGWM